MISRSLTGNRAPRVAGFVICLLLTLGGTSVFGASADPVKYALCDARVLYVCDDARAITWPVLYRLNDHYGCRIDVAVLRSWDGYRAAHQEIPSREIYFHELFLPDNAPWGLDSTLSDLFSLRLPDVVLFAIPSGDSLSVALSNSLMDLALSEGRYFAISSIFQERDRPPTPGTTSRWVVFNVTELAARYEDRMRTELPQIGQAAERVIRPTPEMIRYQLKRGQAQSETDVGLLSGLSRNRLVAILEELLPVGPQRNMLTRQARQFSGSLAKSRDATGRDRVDLVLDAYRSLIDLNDAIEVDSMADGRPDVSHYFEELTARVERAALHVVGLSWDGEVMLRDSPHGPKVKFRASLSANGPREITLQSITFSRPSDAAVVVLDSVPRVVAPHQTFVREYLVPVDRQHLASPVSDSLVFAASIQYGNIPLTVYSTLPLATVPALQVSFDPAFYFVPQPPDLDVDRVVASTTIRVVVTKPPDFSGQVKLHLETPRGLFAGAYRQELDLERETTLETVLIPFSISGLFELGIKRLLVNLSSDHGVFAVDTALVRIASCRIEDTVAIGFLPDSTGRLEDVLRMTDAAHRPLTNRGLLTGELDAYDVIVIGSGSFRNYPDFRRARNRFEDYVRHGGSLVILGQPDDWPHGMMPVSMAPGWESVDRSTITTVIPDARILSHPYDISETNLFSSFYRPVAVASAVVTPAEHVFRTAGGAALLSVSRLGTGQIIYCGLPLLDLMAQLDIDAIHLFANIMNY